ncbi:Iron transport multicopper oxidase FET3 [Tolypocladium capitatum]|uniref:Iron transport multicopper oxidase FET3 n=1 Tax=Tolypocladium capitatum TaxID=45235 RepID=A0A2K3QJD1_9HYPO|nr:Iron transport multicopper oxidase FET3 [Tolypocladium capitatum]
MRDRDDEEDHGLLDEAGAKPPRPERDRAFGSVRGLFTGAAKWTTLAGLMLGTVLALPLLGYVSRGALPVAASRGERQLAIALRPARHAAREATTLTLSWNITLGTRSPDGVEKQVYLVNDQFPGPTIEARSGDRILVNVFNRLESEGVSLHWHGLRMRSRNAMDGAVGFTQCPIPPGGDFVYDFTIGADEHGTFWWHGHGQVQRGDGLYGGLVVHQPTAGSPSTAENDALLLVGDWFHRKQTDVLGWYADFGSLGNEPVPDSLVINGQGRYNCSMAVPARPVTCNQLQPSSLRPLLAGKSNVPTRLRLVNTGTVAGITLMIDGATLHPVAVDGACSVAARPGRSVGILYPGERVDVMVRWDAGDVQQPRLNIYLDDENFGGFPNPALNPNQTFYALPGAAGAAVNDEAMPLQLGPEHRDMAYLTSTSTSTPALPARAQETVLLYLKTQKLSRFENRPLGFVNHTTWEAQTPPLLSLNRTSWDHHQFLPFIGSTSQPAIVDVIINNLDDGSHPIHLHGNSFHLLSSYRAEGRDGWGSYNPYESQPPSALNLVNPVVKDTVSVPRRGHVVLRLTADNPGLWMLHCHMLVHMGTGMVAGLHIGGPGDFDHVQGMDQSAADLCKDVGGEN